MMRVLSIVLLLLASSGAGVTATKACVVSRRGNPEFEASPRNYAHWLLAHAYPAVLEFARQATVRIDSVAVDDSVAGWAPQYRAVLAPWNVSFGGTRDCGVTVEVAVPHLSFCTREYWRDAHAFAVFLRRRLVVPREKRTVFLLLRDDKKNDRSWDVRGLAEACADADWRREWGPDVRCGSFSQDTPLRDVAQELGNAGALIAAHGAGLANAVFLPPGASVVELDAAPHRSHNRFFYAELARNLGLAYRKLWLFDNEEDATTAHFSEVSLPEVHNCTQRRHDGSLIHGNSDLDLRAARIRPYDSPAAISRAALDALLREALASLPVVAEATEMRQYPTGESASHGARSDYCLLEECSPPL